MYYRTLSLLNVFRTTQTTGSCGDFYPKCKVTVSLNGKTSKSVTKTREKITEKNTRHNATHERIHTQV